MRCMVTPVSASPAILGRNANIQSTTAQTILAKMEEPVQAHWIPLFVLADLGLQAHPLAILKMMSAAPARVTLVAP